MQLFILDLMPAAAQPMHSPDGRVALIYKGEIYNWRDGVVGRTWAHLRLEVTRMREFKYKEMKRNWRILKIPRAPHDVFDPRILSSTLQKMVYSRRI